MTEPKRLTDDHTAQAITATPAAAAELSRDTDDTGEVYPSLMQQLVAGKDKTWRERYGPRGVIPRVAATLREAERTDGEMGVQS